MNNITQEGYSGIAYIIRKDENVQINKSENLLKFLIDYQNVFKVFKMFCSTENLKYS